MKFITLFAVLASAVSAAIGLTINTPANVVVCQPTQLTWSGGVAPYFLTIIPAGQVSAPPVKSWPTQQGTALTWNVDLAAGNNVNFALKDSTGATAYSDMVTIQSGTDSSCVNAAVQESGASGSVASPTAASGGSSATSAAGATGATTAAHATTAGSASSSTSSASSSSSSHTSGAGRLDVSLAFGVAGVMGLVGAALF